MLRLIQAIDTRTFLSVLGTPYQLPLARIALIISATADGWLYCLLLPVIILMRPDDSRYLLTTVIMALLLERSLYFVLKNTIRRRRPPAAIVGFTATIVAADEFSLPSGHTSAAFLVVTFLCVGISLLFLPLYLWAASVGASRVILGVHFPTDTLMGAMIGSGIALAVL